MRRITLSATVSALLAAVVLACDNDRTPTAPAPDPVEAVGFATSYGIWSPSGQDSCSPEIHDRYSVVGPDGLVYPTWHPPVDPVTGCTFGHEHGRDPAGSDLYPEVGDIPFGYANQYLETSGFGAPRHEDHVGHKIEWENDMPMRVGEGGSALLSVTCDLLVKLHQGTHSADAFTNNMHEVAYHVRCTDGTGFSATLLTPIGDAGELVVSCDRERHVEVGVANPPISPDGGGKRAIPTAACIQERVLGADRPRFDGALRESWEISGRLKAEGGRTLASFNPYFQVMDPSRFFDPSAAGGVARPVELCALEGLRDRDRCAPLAGQTVAWDSPLSPFKGVRRFVDINSNHVRNADGPRIWWTDPLGQNGRPEPFPGSIRQWIASHDNSGTDLRGAVMGRDRDYDGEGVHAPN